MGELAGWLWLQQISYIYKAKIVAESANFPFQRGEEVEAHIFKSSVAKFCLLS